MEQIANLTDLQIHEIYFHDRDEYGSILFKQSPAVVYDPSKLTFEQTLERLEANKSSPFMNAESYERCLKEVYQKFGKPFSENNSFQPNLPHDVPLSEQPVVQKPPVKRVPIKRKTKK